jgi:predicted ferric reductase
MITTTPLPSWRTSWVNKLFASIRKFKLSAAEEGRMIAKKNQFGIGEINFNYLAILLIVMPCLGYFLATMDRRLINVEPNPDRPLTAERKMLTVANTSGIVGVLALAFFLIPVTRHSVLLAAMGWSPVQALRLHVWAGFTSFFFIFLHSVLYMADWWAFNEATVFDQIWPNPDCWVWNPNGTISRDCRSEWYYLTGLFAALWFLIILVTSLNWFRRRWYRVFYLCHVIFGSAMLFTAICHWSPLVTYLMPSLLYYLASTTPTLIQALASRFRGGVKIVKVVSIPDSGGCVEVCIEADSESNAALDRQPCLFVKLCIPSISVVWHPFTVFKHTDDTASVRFLFRPVGPFTKEAAKQLTAPERPVTLLDGFYQGGDRVQEAFQHDHITIVAGGVAITPFLSMIPSLLSGMGRAEKGAVLPKKIELIWVCREIGLIGFIRDSYLNGLLQTAALLDVDFTVCVYHTGGATKEDPMMDVTELTASMDSNEIKVDTENPTPPSADSTNHDSTSILDSSSASGGEGYPAASSKSVLQGRAMQVGRMMPGRNGQAWRNLPLFVAGSFTIWVGYHVIYFWYAERENNFNEVIGRSWGTLITLLMAVGFAILIEATATLVAPKYWPEPQHDTFDIEEYLTNHRKEGLEVSTDTINVEMKRGRPDPSEILEGASLAEAPGVFLCGPVRLVDSVRKEASHENGICLTRCVIYDEPFEM